jgi:acyl-CoA synthetase (AMP-forming)/AMP-acid ligase II
MSAAVHELPATIPHVIARASRRHPQAVAVEYQGRRVTFGELEYACNRATAGFLAYGLHKGDRVAVWAPNIPEWIVAAVGAQAAGGVLVPLNTRLKGKEAGYILRRSGARLLFTVGNFLGTSYPGLLAGESLPALERIVDLTGEPGSLETFAKFMSRGSAVADTAVIAAREQLGADDLADIMFTSGTTGDPKGVMSSHGQNVWTSEAWSSAVGLCGDDRYLIVNPFFHTFGYKAGWLACVLRGATALPVAVFDAGAVMRRVIDDRVSVLPGPPALFQAMLAHELCGRIDLASLRLAVTGAANVPPILIERMREVLGFRTVLTGYGLTEAAVVTMCRHGDSNERIALTCGAPIPGVEVKCLDELGRDVGQGEPGEVLVRGPNVMRGYFDDPEATAGAIDANGWLHTGDVGTLDADGYLRITDRKKDVFICGGFNCYPAEIEKLMSAHPAIGQVAVIGVPDRRLGEVAKAFVVLRPDADCDLQSIGSWCRENMANYKVPRYIERVATLPTTASGKVQKFALR